jgi:hypothetical protein
VFGGRDLEKRGTWLGVTGSARLACVITTDRDGEWAMKLFMWIGKSVVLPAICAVGTVTQWAMAAATDDPVEVGVVADFRPVDRPPVLSRPPHGDPVQVRIGTVVIAGDQVILDKVDQSMTVQLADGDVMRFVGPGDFRVPNGRSLGKLAAIFQSLPELFNDTHGLSGTAASRSVEECGMSGFEPAPVTAPLQGSDARVLAGSRDLLLAWNGGCPPFSVTLSSSVTTLAHRESISDWHVSLYGLALMPGRYTVRISDSEGRHWEGTLHAQSQLPPIPAEVASDNSALGRNAQAICLARADAGRWRLESVNRFYSYGRAGDPFAIAISDRLLRGTNAERLD